MVYARPNEAVMKFSGQREGDRGGGRGATTCTRIIYGALDLSSVYNTFTALLRGSLKWARCANSDSAIRWRRVSDTVVPREHENPLRTPRVCIPTRRNYTGCRASSGGTRRRWESRRLFCKIAAPFARVNHETLLFGFDSGFACWPVRF